MSPRRNVEAGQGPGSSAEAFGKLLKHYRERARMTQAALAEVLHCDRSLLARFEAGTRVPDENVVRVADHELRTGDALMVLWEETDWYPVVEHPDWFKRRADMDAVATELRIYETMVMPGLLQCEEYIRAMYEEFDPSDDLDHRVRARLSRQVRFLDEAGPLLIAVLDESCLRTVVGGPSVMRLQFEHLLAMIARQNMRIQVAPARRPGLQRPFRPLSLITLPDGHQWLYSESLDRGHFSDDPAAVRRHMRTYDVLRADVLSVTESAALVREAMEGYEQDEQPRSQRRDLGQEQLQQRQRWRLRGNRLRHPRRRPRA